MSVQVNREKRRLENFLPFFLLYFLTTFILPLNVKAANFMTFLSEKSFLMTNDCNEFNNKDAYKHLLNQNNNCFSNSQLSPASNELYEQIRQLQSLKAIPDHILEENFFKKLISEHAKELECASTYAEDFSETKYEKQINETIEKISEIKKLKYSLSIYATDLVTNPQHIVRICPPDLASLNEMIRPEFPQRGLAICERIIKLRAAIDVLKTSIALSNLEGPVKDMLEEVTTYKKNTPITSNAEIAEKVKSAYADMSQHLKSEQQELLNKINTQGIESFSRSEKRMLFSDPRINQKLSENSSDTQGLVCKMNARYGEGADRLDLYLGVGSFAVGGLVGLGAKGAKIAIVSRALTSARATGLLSANSARLMKVTALAAAFGADSLVGLSDLGNSCLKETNLTYKIDSRSKAGDCVSSPKFEEQDQESCLLMASLAALGFVGGISDLSLLKTKLPNSSIKYLELGISESDYKYYSHQIKNLTSTNEKLALYQDFILKVMQEGDSYEVASKKFESLFDSLNLPLEKFAKKDFISKLSSHHIENLFANRFKKNIQDALFDLDTTSIDEYFEFARSLNQEPDQTLQSLFYHLKNNSNQNSKQTLEYIAKYRKNSVFIDGEFLFPPYSSHELKVFLTTEVITSIDDSERLLALRKLTKEIERLELSVDQKEALQLNLALDLVKDPEGANFIKKFFSKSDPKIKSFFESIEDLKNNPRLLDEDKSISIDEIQKLSTQFIEAQTKLGIPEDQALKDFFDYLDFTLEKQHPARALILDHVASNRIKTPYLFGRLGSPELNLTGSYSFLSRTIDRIGRDIEADEFYSEYLLEMQRLGHSQEEANLTLLNHLSGSTIPKDTKESLALDVKRSSPKLYYDHKIENVTSSEDANQIFLSFVENHIQNGGDLESATRTFKSTYFEKLQNTLPDLARVTNFTPNFNSQLDTFLKLNPKWKYTNFHDLFYKGIKNQEELDSFIKDFTKFSSSKYSIEKVNSIIAIALEIRQLKTEYTFANGFPFDKFHSFLDSLANNSPQVYRLGHYLVTNPLTDLRSNPKILISIKNRSEALETFLDFENLMLISGQSPSAALDSWQDLVRNLNIDKHKSFLLEMKARPVSATPDSLTRPRDSFPESVMSTAPYQSLNTLIESTISKSLKNTRVTKVRSQGIGLNQAMIVTLEDGTKGIWKAHNFEGSNNLKAEVLAFEIDQLLGLKLVPTTVERKIAGEMGSLQLFVEHDPSAMIKPEGTTDLRKYLNPNSPHYERTLKDLDKQSFFDYLIENRDRHSGNFLVGPEGNIISIDNGSSFTGLGGILHHRDLSQRKEEIVRFMGTAEGRTAMEKLKSSANISFYSQIARNLGEEDTEDFVDRMNELITLYNKLEQNL